MPTSARVQHASSLQVPACTAHTMHSITVCTFAPMFAPLRQLLQPPSGMSIDFTQPARSPALAPADGISWRVFSNPVTLFIGGVTAVLLELAEPRVRTGVWEHSSFRRDPLGRLHRTGYAAMVTVYAPQDQARALIARVVRMHDHVKGLTPDGTPYHANHPELLDWVQATAIFGFTQAFDRYAQALHPHEKDQAFAEGQASAQLYGATGLPHDWLGWQTLLARTAPQLQDHAIVAEFLHIMRTTALLPGPFQAFQRLLVQAAIDITPAPVRQFAAPNGECLRPWQQHLVGALARTAQQLQLPQLPPSQARKRMRAG